MKKNLLIVILGPTAIGKTTFSINLAKRLHCDILSADSRQFYQELSIGTAKPTAEEMSGVNHHFIDSRSIHENYTAGQFEIDVLKCLEGLFKNNDQAIMVGGSGMYIDAVCNGIDPIPSSKIIRDKLNYEYEKYGIVHLQKELKKRDPDHYAIMDIYNPQRIIRALEVCRHTEKTYTSFRSKKIKDRPFSIIKIGLTIEREDLYNRINKRVDKMMEDGLLNEAEKVYKFKELNALRTVGYNELFSFFEKKVSLSKAIDEIKIHTRHYAKRQLTWFKNDETIKWFHNASKDEIYYFIDQFLLNE